VPAPDWSGTTTFDYVVTDSAGADSAPATATMTLQATADASGVNPLDHYHQFGWHEGRDPSVGFDTTAYLAANPDVAAAHIDPLAHFLQFGIHEGRSPQADGVWG
jgi:hypothetical protein